MSITKSTIAVYEYSSDTNELTIPFDYLKRDFVVVSLEGKGKQQKYLKLGTDYIYTTKTTIVVIRKYTPSEGYTKIVIRRVTDASKRIVNYQDGSILNAMELNISQLQALYVAEEARDLTAYTLFVNNDGDLDARGRVIRNLGDPTNPQDAVTKKYVDTASESVIESRDATFKYRNEAEEFKNQTQRLRNESEAFKNTSEQKATEITDKINIADGLNSQAMNNADKAKQYALDAQRSASNASQAEKNAQESDKNAAKSAQDAKNWSSIIDPTRFVYKDEGVSVIPSAAVLKAYEPLSDKQVVYLKGFYDNSTLGSGHFISDYSDEESLDNSGTVIVTSTGKRWKRMGVTNVIHLDWFGVKGDGSFDNIQCIRKALTVFDKQKGGKLVLEGNEFGSDFVVKDSINIIDINNIEFYIPKGTTLRMLEYAGKGHLLGFGSGTNYGSPTDNTFVTNVGITGGGTLRTPYDLFNSNVIGFERARDFYCIGMNIPESGRKAITTQVNNQKVPTMFNGGGIIKDNIIGRCKHTAISIEQGCDDTVIIEGNRIKEAGHYGITAYGVDNPNLRFKNVIIKNNTIDRAAVHGIYVYKADSILIDSNYVGEAGERGLNIDLCETVCVDKMIVLKATKEVGRLTRNSAVSVENSKLISNSGTPSYYCIYLEGNKGVTTLSSCIIKGASYGFAIKADSYTVFDNCNIDRSVKGSIDPSRGVHFIKSCVIDSKFVTSTGASVVDYSLESSTSVVDVSIYSYINLLQREVSRNLSGFLRGREGQVVTVVFNDSNTTIQQGTIKLKGGVSVLSKPFLTMQFIKVGAYWYEL